MARRRSAGCLAMIIFMILGGALASVGYFLILRPEMRVDRSFFEAPCVVLGKELISEQKKSRRTGKRKSSSTKTHYRPEFHIRYEVAGQSLEARTWRIVRSSSTSKSSQEEVLERFEVGKTYPCWFDPSDPATVVIEKGVSTGGKLLTGLGLLFFLIGACGAITAPLRVLRKDV